MAQFSGVLGPLGWFAALIYLFFAVAFGFFIMPQKKAAYTTDRATLQPPALSGGPSA
jgi:hypothetical protein